VTVSQPEFDIDFPYSQGKPTTSADFRTTPEDFIVEEQLGFGPAGEGEHLMLHVRKRGENTAWIAEQLAAFFGIKTMDVGYCGLKDRHALTSQWFSLYLPKTLASDDPAKVAAFVSGTDAQLEVLAFSRHRKKLRRGEHQSNRLVLTLRQIVQTPELEERLNQILENGVPN